VRSKMRARMQVDALVHHGIPHGRRRTQELGLRGLAALLGRLERALAASLRASTLRPRCTTAPRSRRPRRARGRGERATSSRARRCTSATLAAPRGWAREPPRTAARQGPRPPRKRRRDTEREVTRFVIPDGVDVQVEARPRSMDALDGPGLHTPPPAPLALGPALVPATQSLPGDARQRAQHLGSRGREA